MKVSVSELLPDDVVLKSGMDNAPLYRIISTWPLTDNEFAAKVCYINSLVEIEKYWKSPDVEVLVDRSE